MKKFLIIIMVLFLMSFFVFSAFLSRAGENLPSADGEKFWTYISKINPYKKWGMWPGHEGMYPGHSPHGAYVKLYANDIALKATRDGLPMPHGAILVKENYNKDKKILLVITPMYKVKGFNPAGGDWFWAKYDPDGTTMTSGRIDGCINCHSVQKSRDWIFTPLEMPRLPY
jgi:hypothetical protein